MASKKRQIRFTAEEREVFKKLGKEFRRQPKKKRIKLLGIIIPLLTLAFVISVIAERCRKENAPPLPEDSLTVCYIDVGQGDSALVSCGGKNMLIDCGESSGADNVISFLNEKDVKRLDYVIATHPHSDHMGGMYKIVDNFDIGQIIIPHLDESDIPTTRYFEKFLDSCESGGLSLTEAKPGKSMDLGDAKVEIIAPCSEKYDNTNISKIQ